VGVPACEAEAFSGVAKARVLKRSDDRETQRESRGADFGPVLRNATIYARVRWLPRAIILREQDQPPLAGASLLRFIIHPSAFKLCLRRLAVGCGDWLGGFITCQ